MRARVVVVASLFAAPWAVSALGGESRRIIDASRALDAGAAGPPSVEVSLTRTPPDPPPLVERKQWVFDLRWEGGQVWLLGTRRLELSTQRATPRVMGRFALELFEGAALVERVRFDFPLLGVPDLADGGPNAPPSLNSKLRTRVGVVFPATARGTRLELVDRATDRRWSLAWPPQEAATAPYGGKGP